MKNEKLFKELTDKVQVRKITGRTITEEEKAKAAQEVIFGKALVESEEVEKLAEDIK